MVVIIKFLHNHIHLYSDDPNIRTTAATRIACTNQSRPLQRDALFNPARIRLVIVPKGRIKGQQREGGKTKEEMKSDVTSVLDEKMGCESIDT